MRRYSLFAILAFVFLSISCISCAAVKVIESSTRPAPKWAYGAEEGFLIVSAEASDPETAKNKAFNAIKKQMVNSIAETVHSSSYRVSEEVEVNNIYTSMDMYKEQVATESANVPFLSHVTLAKVADFYWEHKQDKKEGIDFYVYHLKYPFSRADQEELVAKFEAQEAEINNKIKAFQNEDFSTYTSVEQMVEQATAVRTFQSSLMENDTRRKTCDHILRGYKANVEQLSIRAISVDREKTLYELYYGDQKMDCNIRPYLRTKCLQKMDWQVKDGVAIVTYDYSSCDPDEQNYIDITITILGKKINHRFYVQ